MQTVGGVPFFAARGQDSLDGSRGLRFRSIRTLLGVEGVFALGLGESRSRLATVGRMGNLRVCTSDEPGSGRRGLKISVARLGAHHPPCMQAQAQHVILAVLLSSQDRREQTLSRLPPPSTCSPLRVRNPRQSLHRAGQHRDTGVPDLSRAIVASHSANRTIRVAPRRELQAHWMRRTQDAGTQGSERR